MHSRSLYERIASYLEPDVLQHCVVRTQVAPLVWWCKGRAVVANLCPVAESVAPSPSMDEETPLRLLTPRMTSLCLCVEVIDTFGVSQVLASHG